MRRSYDVSDGGSRHHDTMGWSLSDPQAAVVAVTVVLAVWAGGRAGVAAAVAVAVIAALGRRRALAVVVLLLGPAGGLLSSHAWAEAHPHRLGPYVGWAEVMADPAPLGRGWRVTLEVEGERFDAMLFGAAAGRLSDLGAGQYVWVSGARRPSTGDVRRAQVRHVVGRFTLEVAGDVVEGSAVSRADNRIRRAMRHSADTVMAPDDAALFLGLVIGDDARQPAWMVEQFRSSGLSHLTAVSGQNVAFVLAAAAPLLRRLRPWPRWAATVGVVLWFMALTRFEPSVLRAGAMAIVAATGFVLGRRPRPIRLLAVAVAVLVLVDPLLVWSVGFWLSVGATLGVCVAGPWWQARLPGPAWLRASLGVTLGAQCGVAVPSLLVFHRLPVVSLLANPMAVPVAGAVMLIGLPTALAAAALPSAVARVVMVPSVLGTRWVATVARVASAAEPSGWWPVVGWAVAVGVLVALVRRPSSLSRSWPSTSSPATTSRSSSPPSPSS